MATSLKKPPIPVVIAELQAQPPEERNPASVKSLVRRINNKLNYAMKEEAFARQLLAAAEELLPQ